MPGLRDVMVNFFKLVSAQIGEVGRIEQRCAQRIRRFFASGTAEQARGLARQINETLAAGHALLRESVVDSLIQAELPIGRSAVSTIGALSFTIKDPSPPAPAQQATPSTDLSGFAGLATQVDMSALTALVNSVVTAGPVSLPEMIGMVDAPYLGDVVVLWALALKQETRVPASEENRQVRFRSLTGGECVMEVPPLMFVEPVPTLEEL